MKSLALISSRAAAQTAGVESFTARVHGTPLDFALVDVARPDFGLRSAEHAGHVLVRVEALSCNYRDAGLMLQAQDRLRQADRPALVHLGSDFVGRVEEVGSGVRSVRRGDRVIPDSTYPVDRAPRHGDGVPSNHASRGWLVLPEDKVRAVPQTVPAVSAAAVGLNGQTAASLVRRAGVGPGDRVLVTAGRSNTSLSLLAQLAARGVRATVLSSRAWTEQERHQAGDPDVVLCDRGSVPFSDAPVAALEGEVFDAVIDPFFDMFLLRVMPHLRHGGTYLTCGLKNQHTGQLDDEDDVLHRVPVQQLYGLLADVMVGNKAIVGNCIGLRSDLDAVVGSLADGTLNPVVDSTFDVARAREFVHRSFDAQQRFGKVVLTFEADAA